MDCSGSGYVEVHDQDHRCLEGGAGVHALPVPEIRQDDSSSEAVEQARPGRQEEEEGGIAGISRAIQGEQEEADGPAAAACPPVFIGSGSRSISNFAASDLQHLDQECAVDVRLGEGKGCQDEGQLIS